MGCRKFRIARKNLREIILVFLLKMLGFREILTHWIYEKTLNDSSWIIDLGANLGHFTTEILNRGKYNIIQVEANPILYNKLSKEHLKYNVAISNYNGSCKFYISANNEASSIFSDFQNHWPANESKEVQCITISSFLAQLDVGVFDLIKVDIEGAEIQLIEDFCKNETKLVKQISFEFHHNLNRNLKNKTFNAIDCLRANDYVLFSSKLNLEEAVFVKRSYLKFSTFELFVLRLFNIVAFRNNKIKI